MSADPNQLQAQIDALNARRQMAMEMAQQPGMQQQVVNGRVMDMGFAPALQGIARLISQGRAAQMGDKIAQLSGQVNAAKQQRADAAMRDLLGGNQEQPQTAPIPQAPTGIAAEFKRPEMSGSSMPSQNMPLPPTAPRPMDSFLPNLLKAQRYINAGGNPVIADAFLKQNAVENKPDVPKQPKPLEHSADGLLFDPNTNQYKDPDGNVLSAKQVKDWKISLAQDRSLAVSKAKPGSSFDPEDGALLAAFAERGVTLPAGLRSKEQQVSTLHGLRNRNQGLTPDEIADKVASGQIDFGAEKKETQIAAGMGGKIRYAENEIKQIVPLVRDASSRVPRGSFVPYNKLQQLADSNISDPNLKEFKAYMTTLSNAYDMLAARGGTDMAKREHNRQMFDTADSPQALEAALKAVEAEASASGKAADAASAPRSKRNEAPQAVHWNDLK